MGCRYYYKSFCWLWVAGIATIVSAGYGLQVLLQEFLLAMVCRYYYKSFCWLCVAGITTRVSTRWASGLPSRLFPTAPPAPHVSPATTTTTAAVAGTTSGTTITSWIMNTKSTPSSDHRGAPPLPKCPLPIHPSPKENHRLCVFRPVPMSSLGTRSWTLVLYPVPETSSCIPARRLRPVSRPRDFVLYTARRLRPIHWLRDFVLYPGADFVLYAARRLHPVPGPETSSWPTPGPDISSCTPTHRLRPVSGRRLRPVPRPGGFVPYHYWGLHHLLSPEHVLTTCVEQVWLLLSFSVFVFCCRLWTSVLTSKFVSHLLPGAGFAVVLC